MNRSIHIEYPSHLPDTLQMTPAEFEREARLAMAVKLYERSASLPDRQLSRPPLNEPRF
jgi:hypothetical protein